MIIYYLLNLINNFNNMFNIGEKVAYCQSWFDDAMEDVIVEIIEQKCNTYIVKFKDELISVHKDYLSEVDLCPKCGEILGRICLSCGFDENEDYI